MRLNYFLFIYVAVSAFVGNALGGDIPLDFQVGRINFKGDQVGFSFQHQDQTTEHIIVKNLTLVEDRSTLEYAQPKKVDGERVDEMLKVQPPKNIFSWLVRREIVNEQTFETETESDKDQKKIPQLDMASLPLRGESFADAIESLIFGIVTFENGQRNIVVLGSNKHSPTSTVVGWIQLAQIPKQPGVFVAQSWDFNSLMLHTFPTVDCIALSTHSLGGNVNIEVFGMNFVNANFLHIDIRMPVDGSRVHYNFSASGGPALVVLPANIDREEIAKKKYSFKLDRENKKISLFKGDGSFQYDVHLGRVSAKSKVGSEIEKSARLVDWVAGLKNIEQYVSSQVSDSNPSISEDLLSSMSSWFLEAESSSLGATGNRTNVALLSVSAPVNDALPELKENVLHSIIQRIMRSKSDKRMKFPPALYLHLSPESIYTDIKLDLVQANYLQDKDERGDGQGYFFIDMTQSDADKAHQNLTLIFDFLTGSSKPDFKKNQIVVIGTKKIAVAINLVLRKYAAGFETINLDNGLTETQKIEVLGQGLQLPDEQVHQMIHEVKVLSTETSGSSILGNLESVITILKPFVEQMSSKSSLDLADFPRRLARAFLYTIGYTTLPSFSTELKQKVSKLENAMIASDTLFARQDQIGVIKDRLLGFMGRGYKRRRPLVLTEMGDSGTGKTLTITNIASYLDAAVASVNLAELKQVVGAKKYKKGIEIADVYEWAPRKEEKPVFLEAKDVIQVINNSALELRSDARPLKILLIDEAHGRPDVLAQLLPSFGEDDSANASVNLEGIVVVLMMNVNLKSDNYKALVSLSPHSPDYRTRVAGLFEDSFVNVPDDKKIDEKIVHALSTRLMQGMIFFPPSGNDAEVQKELLDRVIRDLEREERIRLIVPQNAYKLLINKALDSAKQANFRGLDTSLQSALDEIIGAYYAKHPGIKDQLSGRYLVSVEVKKSGDKSSDYESLVLEELEDSEVGSKLDIKDSYQRFADRMVRAMKYAKDAYQDSVLIARVKKDKASAKTHEVMAEAIDVIQQSFVRAVNKPFYIDEIPAAEQAQAKIPAYNDLTNRAGVLRFSPEPSYPDNLSDADKKQFQDQLEVPIVKLFEQFLDGTADKKNGSKEKELQQLAQMASVVIKAMGLFKKADAQLSINDVKNSKFRQWISSIVELDQFDQITEDTKKAKNAQKDFITSQWNEWQKLKDKIAKMHQIERDQALFEFASSISKKFHALTVKQPTAGRDGSLASQFVTALKNQKERDVEALIKDLEKESETSGGGVVALQSCTDILSLQHHSIEKTVGWVLAEISRKAAEKHLSNTLRDQKLESQKLWPSTGNSSENPMSDEVRRILGF